MGLLTAMATGAGGEAGRRLWGALSGLVHRTPEQPSDDPAAPPASPTGVGELAALNAHPDDAERARALSEALNRRALLDASFGAALTAWHQQARALRTGDGATVNAVSGGTQHGPVVQGRDFSGITFNAPDNADPPGR
ncbi:hypothetical protein ACFWNK_01060 [Streptomyces sp. NPDC058417]|uniref:hypothetical protein n=1 Tax=unclassified Streptomyces TaxID=2593676 RepID=UPI0036588DBC